MLQKGITFAIGALVASLFASGNSARADTLHDNPAPSAPAPSPDAKKEGASASGKPNQRNLPGERGDLGASVGIGTSYGFVGLQLGWALHHIPSVDHLEPYACIGTVGGQYSKPYTTYCAGVIGFWGGHHHRALLDFGFQPVALYVLHLHGIEVGVRPAYGVSLQFGYEYLTAIGFFARIGLGPGATLIDGVHLGSGGQLGIGWRL
ncbi:MAG TPA: hypothetical protein VHM70_00920 [Polyangiaceae bacterium]|jgi:hypothetical protein|nr:hypothetical protein [Polyangiaceae bacterium]